MAQRAMARDRVTQAAIDAFLSQHAIASFHQLLRAAFTVGSTIAYEKDAAAGIRNREVLPLPWTWDALRHCAIDCEDVNVFWCGTLIQRALKLRERGPYVVGAAWHPSRADAKHVSLRGFHEDLGWWHIDLVEPRFLAVGPTQPVTKPFTLTPLMT